MREGWRRKKKEKQNAICLLALARRTDRLSLFKAGRIAQRILTNE